MSTRPLEQIAEDIIVQYCYRAAVVIYWYDYLLTLGNEIRYVWHAQVKFSTAACLFYTTRYSGLLHTICMTLTLAQWIEEPMIGGQRCFCLALVYCQFALEALMLACAAVLSVIRVRALNYGRLPLWTVAILGSLNPLSSLEALFTHTPSFYKMPSTAKGCGAFEADRNAYAMLVARLSTMCADGLVLLLSIIKTRGILRLHKPLHSDKPISLSEAVFKGSAISFLILFAINAICTMLCLLGLGSLLWPSLQIVDLLSSWVALSAALVTYRFLLDLREASDSTIDSAASQSDIIFANMDISGGEGVQSSRDVDN